MDPSWVILNHLRVVGVWTKRGTTGRPPETRSIHGGTPPPDDHAGQISRPTAAGCAWIGPAKRRRRPPWVTGHFMIFRPFQAIFSQHIAPSHHFWALSTHSRGPFLHIPHHLKVMTKTKLADSWIVFFGHHSDCWTKVMVLMSSWSLGLSIDMWFVNFVRRLVCFPFLGCFG